MIYGARIALTASQLSYMKGTIDMGFVYEELNRLIKMEMLNVNFDIKDYPQNVHVNFEDNQIIFTARIDI